MMSRDPREAATAMIAIRKADERGRFDLGWLDTRHTFSFGDYYDPEQMGFRSLRVINEDRVRPGAGFPMHGHRDMEILTYVLSGELAHRDSLGHGATLGPGEVQRMTAGTGIRHSEFNPSDDEAVHLLQTWIVPDRRGHEPSYEQRPCPPAAASSTPPGPRGRGRRSRSARTPTCSPADSPPATASSTGSATAGTPGSRSPAGRSC